MAVIIPQAGHVARELFADASPTPSSVKRCWAAWVLLYEALQNIVEDFLP